MTSVSQFMEHTLSTKFQKDGQSYGLTICFPIGKQYINIWFRYANMPKQQDEEKQVVVVPPKYEDLYFEYISGQSVTAPVRGNNILSLCEFQDIVTAWQTSWLLSLQGCWKAPGNIKLT